MATHKPSWKALSPVPKNRLSLPKQVHEKSGDDWIGYDIQYYWAYYDQRNNLLGYVIRYQIGDKKETPPLAFCEDENGKHKWKRIAWWGEKRPLFHLDKLAHAPHSQVIISEGEKCAEALQGIIEGAGHKDKITAVSWPGGVNSVEKIDWSPLAGRKIVAWPDFDQQKNKTTTEQPGYLAMVYICNAVKKLGANVKLLYPVEGKPDGWDVADAIIKDHWDFKTIFEFIKANLVDPPEIAEEPAPDPAEAPAEYEDIPPPEPDTWPFRVLGYNNNYYFYLPSGTRQVRAIPGEGHATSSLMTLAPLEFWERTFFGARGPDWKYAANLLMRLCEKEGVYTPMRQRGRGAWYDNGRSVLHLGDRLIVDGNETRIQDLKGKYIYEAGAALEYTHAQPLDNQESSKLRSITDMLLWDRPIHSTLLAGWCVIAPICGALKCRPHVWLTGKAGSGKTYAIDNIIKPCLGEFALNTTTPTTAPGIRQALGCDALPVLNDEFEGTDWAEDKRVQDILQLARQAFSDSAAKIFKGGQNGKASVFEIRSCFFMSSITVNLNQYADETRINVLSLREPIDNIDFNAKQHFEKLNAVVSETLTAEWCAALRARSIKLIPVIAKNAEVFATAVGDRLGKRRAGDQVGGLLAGAYSLVSSNVIDYEKAKVWVEAQDWSEQIKVTAESDERKCLQHILQSVVKRGSSEVSVSELLWELHCDAEYSSADRPGAGSVEGDTILRRHGLRYDKCDGLVWISESHPGIRRILSNTSWHKSAARLLSRIAGAEKKPSMRFIGPPTRAVGVPWVECFGG